MSLMGPDTPMGNPLDLIAAQAMSRETIIVNRNIGLIENVSKK